LGGELSSGFVLFFVVSLVVLGGGMMTQLSVYCPDLQVLWDLGGLKKSGCSIPILVNNASIKNHLRIYYTKAIRNGGRVLGQDSTLEKCSVYEPARLYAEDITLDRDKRCGRVGQRPLDFRRGPEHITLGPREVSGFFSCVTRPVGR